MRVASLWEGTASPAGQSGGPPYTHLGAAWGTADKRPLLLQIHLGFLINLKGQGERGRKTEIHEYLLLLPEKGNGSEPPPMPIPKLDEKNINTNNRSCLAEVY